MPSTHPTIGAKLRAFRDARGWTLRELESRTGFPFSLISRWENQKADPDFDQTCKLAQALEIPSEWLWDPKPAPKWLGGRARKEHAGA